METRVVTNRSAPAATIVPILIYEDVGQAIDWLCQAFGFTERLRAERDGVIGHAQLAVAEGTQDEGSGAGRVAAGQVQLEQGDPRAPLGRHRVPQRAPAEVEHLAGARVVQGQDGAVGQPEATALAAGLVAALLPGLVPERRRVRDRVLRDGNGAGCAFEPAAASRGRRR